MNRVKVRILNKLEYEIVAIHLTRLGYKWNCSKETPIEYCPFDNFTLYIYPDKKVITYSILLHDGISVSDFIKSTPLPRDKKRNKDLIVIYRNGDKVVAKNKVTGKIGEAKCHPDDEFDFNIGAKLAFDRLIKEDEIIESKEKYYTGKAVCTLEVVGFTRGKIYAFVNGETVDDDQDTRPLHDRVRDINDIYNGAFVEIVE